MPHHYRNVVVVSVGKKHKTLKFTLSRKFVEFMPSLFKSFWLQVIDFKSTLSHFRVNWGQIEPLVTPRLRSRLSRYRKSTAELVM